MATKTDYYNRIISSLQSEITGLNATVNELQKEMEEMRGALKLSVEKNSSAKEIPVESGPSGLSLKTLPRKEVEILISKMKKVCDEAIKANHENYVEMFAMQSELSSLRDHIETTFLSAEKFRDYQSAQEIRIKSLEEKIGRRVSFLTVNSHSQKSDEIMGRSNDIDTLLRLVKQLNPYWLLSVLTFLFIVLLAFYLFNTIVP